MNNARKLTPEELAELLHSQGYPIVPDYTVETLLEHIAALTEELRVGNRLYAVLTEKYNDMELRADKAAKRAYTLREHVRLWEWVPTDERGRRCLACDQQPSVGHNQYCPTAAVLKEEL